jgi:hypothetical protein
VANRLLKLDEKANAFGALRALVFLTIAKRSHDADEAEYAIADL